MAGNAGRLCVRALRCLWRSKEAIWRPETERRWSASACRCRLERDINLHRISEAMWWWCHTFAQGMASKTNFEAALFSQPVGRRSLVCVAIASLCRSAASRASACVQSRERAFAQGAASHSAVFARDHLCELDLSANVITPIDFARPPLSQSMALQYKERERCCLFHPAHLAPAADEVGLASSNVYSCSFGRIIHRYSSSRDSPFGHRVCIDHA